MKPFFLFATLLGLLVTPTADAQMSISYPVDRAVFQRNSSGQASFAVAGQCLITNSDYELQVRIRKLNVTNGNYVSTSLDWWTFAYSRPYGGLFSYSVSGLTTGWYSIDIRALISGNPAASGSVKVGVGEVFLIAGQSNSQGVTNTSTSSTSPYDGVVADLHTEDCSDDIPQFPSMSPLYDGYSIATQGPTNWCYTALGNGLADDLGTPVAFFNGSRAATTVLNWEESRFGGATYNIYNNTYKVCEKDGQPYKAFKNVMNYYGSIFGTRGVLWHQGESDNQTGTSQSDYQSRLGNVISTSRNDFNSNLGWHVARATYFDDASNLPGRTGDTWPDVINAQDAVGSASLNQDGPGTDNIQIPRPDGVHFGGSGLNTLAGAWKNGSLTSTTAISANGMPAMTGTKNGDGTYTLTAASGYSNYYWVNANGQLKNAFSTNQSITVSGSSGSYRYYAKNSQGAGNYVFSQLVYVPFPAGSARLAAEPVAEEINGYSLNLSPNPSSDQATVKIMLPQATSVKLEIIDQQGSTVKVLADNIHAAGSYTYPTSLERLPDGLYFCRMRAGDLFLSQKLIKGGQ